MFEKYFGSEKSDLGQEVKQTKDGGYIIVGYTYKRSGFSDLWLVKTDKYGEVEWDKIFGGNNVDDGVNVEETPDGGYSVLGTTSSFGNGSSDIWLIKTDSQGNEEWSKTFGYQYSDRGFSFKLTADGGYIITGGTSVNTKDGNWNIWMIKTDAVGNEEWNQIFPSEIGGAGRHVVQTTDHGFILLGTQSVYSPLGTSIPIIIKTDQNGNKEWETIIEGDGLPRGQVIKETRHGDFVVIGSKRSPNLYRDIWILKIDSKGQELWQKTLGGSKNDIGWDLDITKNGDYILLGQTNSYGAGHIDAWLFKTNSNGDVACREPMVGQNLTLVNQYK